MGQATIIIAAWNAEATLTASISSALAQKAADQVIVANDASTDGTAALVRDLAAREPRLSLVDLKENGGPSAARNAALREATGDWIAVLDADDAMRPGRLETLIGCAEAHGADILSDDLVLVTAGAEEGRSFLGAHAPSDPVRLTLSDYLAGNQARNDRPSLGFLKPIFRRAFLDAHRLRYDESLRNGEDFHLVLAALAAGGALWLVPHGGYLYTTRAGSISNRLDAGHAAALARADARFLDAHSGQIPHEARRLLQRRSRRIADLATAETALQALKARRVVAAVGALARHPRAIGRFLSQLVEAARKRLHTA